MVCMAKELPSVTPNISENTKQKHAANKNKGIKQIEDSFHSEFDVHFSISKDSAAGNHQVMERYDDDSFLRPRSFSDASVSSGRHSLLGRLQEKLERGSSMKVIVCRETEVISGPDKGKKMVQDMVTVSSHQPQTSSGAAKNTLARSRSVKGREDLPRRDPPGKGLSIGGEEQPPPKPKLPENYRQYFAQQLKNQKHNVLPVPGNKNRQKQPQHQMQNEQQKKDHNAIRVQNDGGLKERKLLNEMPGRPKSKSVSFAENPTVHSSRQTHVRPVKTEKASGSAAQSNSGISFSEQLNVLYRHHDPKYQSELLRRELDKLRTSEYVRRNSETVRQRLSSSNGTGLGGSSVKFALDMPGLVDEAFVEVKKSDIRTVHSQAVQKPVLRQTKSFDLEPDHGLGNKDQTSGETRIHSSCQTLGAFPQSGALPTGKSVTTRDDSSINFAQSVHKSHEPRRTSSSKGSAQARSKSETAAYRNSSRVIENTDRSRQAERSGRDQQAQIDRPKSPSNLRRKHDTIRRFNNTSVQSKREKVRREFYQSHKGAKLENADYSSDDELSESTRKPISEVGKVAEQNASGGMKMDRTIGDNRSDEEKYAALSRNKIVHAKSSSVDSQLSKPKETGVKISVTDRLRELLSDPISAHINLSVESSRDREMGKIVPDLKADSIPALPPKTKSVVSESQSFSSTESIEKFYLKENKRSKSNIIHSDQVLSDSEAVINKGAKNVSKILNPSSNSSSSLVSLTSSSQGKIVVRQCKIGTDVAFSLVGVQNSCSIVSKQPNGNGYLDGQGLVTIRMIPDEQGRFGFNVKGGADQGMPIIVSRVAPNTPADNAIPRLNEGDQVLFINGRDVSQHTHEQVVMFIRASRETHSGELVLKVRPNAYSGDENSEEPDLMYDPETHQISSVTSGANALDMSLKLLEESLESGAALAQFEQLYRKKPGMTMNAARLEANIPKNRYRDISPYDQTRVIMKNGVTGDYINANYVNMEIPVSGIVNRYIAAQGPLPTTCADFWQMIWEQQSTLVVMLTTKVERGRIKCHQYWPDHYTTTDYGTLQITCVKEEETDSFAFREFNLTHVELREERHISHMQYIAWPDHGVPDDPADFLEFVLKVRQKRLGLVEPSIVHCSAGIGRTGVLITMETAMCLIEANQPVYPLSIVRQMRDQRAMLIQTPNQYKFVCEAILRCYNEGTVKPLPEYQQR